MDSIPNTSCSVIDRWFLRSCHHQSPGTINKFSKSNKKILLWNHWKTIYWIVNFQGIFWWIDDVLTEKIGRHFGSFFIHNFEVNCRRLSVLVCTFPSFTKGLWSKTGWNDDLWGILVITIYNCFGTANWIPRDLALWDVLPAGTLSIFEMLVTPRYGITPIWVSKVLSRDGFNFNFSTTKYMSLKLNLYLLCLVLLL